jgi:hypothetical protein
LWASRRELFRRADSRPVAGRLWWPPTKVPDGGRSVRDAEEGYVTPSWTRIDTLEDSGRNSDLRRGHRRSLSVCDAPGKQEGRDKYHRRPSHVHSSMSRYNDGERQASLSHDSGKTQCETSSLELKTSVETNPPPRMLENPASATTFAVPATSASIWVSPSYKRQSDTRHITPHPRRNAVYSCSGALIPAQVTLQQFRRDLSVDMLFLLVLDVPTGALLVLLSR